MMRLASSCSALSSRYSTRTPTFPRTSSSRRLPTWSYLYHQARSASVGTASHVQYSRRSCPLPPPLRHWQLCPRTPCEAYACAHTGAPPRGTWRLNAARAVVGKRWRRSCVTRACADTLAAGTSGAAKQPRMGWEAPQTMYFPRKGGMSTVLPGLGAGSAHSVLGFPVSDAHAWALIFAKALVFRVAPRPSAVPLP